jgi:hypothetical protein
LCSKIIHKKWWKPYITEPLIPPTAAAEVVIVAGPSNGGEEAWTNPAAAVAVGVMRGQVLLEAKLLLLLLPCQQCSQYIRVQC